MIKYAKFATYIEMFYLGMLKEAEFSPDLFFFIYKCYNTLTILQI